MAERSEDHGALKALKEREARLERRRVKKNLFIQAVSDATDFQQVGACTVNPRSPLVASLAQHSRHLFRRVCVYVNTSTFFCFFL